MALAPQLEGIENVSFNDFTVGVDITGVAQANNTYQWSDDFSRVAGKHMFKFGAAVHLDQVNINPNAMYNGSFLFQGTETGSDFADFLLGIASSYAQADSRRFYLRNQYAGVYAQDSWRVRPNLTLNYGVRWDLLPPWREKYNQLQTLVLGPAVRGLPRRAPRAGLPRRSGHSRHAGAGPPHELRTAHRTGVCARREDQRARGLRPVLHRHRRLVGGHHERQSALRLRLRQLRAAAVCNALHYGRQRPGRGTALSRTDSITVASAQHPNASVDWSQYMPITGVPSFFHQNVTPYSESYTLSIEREVARDTVLRAGYIGTQAHHLLVLISANPGNPALCLSLSRPDNVMPGTATCGPFGESGTYTTRSGQ